MPKPRRRPSLPPQGDTGPNTPAQLKGAEIIEVVEDSGAVFRRKHTDHALEIMAREGEISVRQRDAGLKLHALYCCTEMSPDASFTRVYVDVSPNPSAVSVALAERQSRFAAISRYIPTVLKGVVDHVVLRGHILSEGYSRDEHAESLHRVQLDIALDIIVKKLGI